METFFLACFAFGALFTLASFALGMAGHGAAHVLHGHAGPGVGRHTDASHGPAHHAGAGHHGDAGYSAGAQRGGLRLLNSSSVLRALAWFGEAGCRAVRLGA